MNDHDHHECQRHCEEAVFDAILCIAYLVALVLGLKAIIEWIL